MNKFILNTKCKATPVQIAFMVNYMEEHPEVARGSASTSLHDKLENEKHWEALTKELNALGGAIKTVSKWKQAWRDLKNNVKKKVVYKNTGRGAPTLKNISDIEEQVIAFMGPEVNTGVSTCTTVPDTEVERSISISPFLKQETHSVSPVLPEPPHQVILTTTPAPLTTTKPKCIRRRRLARPIDSFESRMLRLREEKLAIKKEKNLLKREKLNLAKEKIGVLRRIANALEIMTDQLPK